MSKARGLADLGNAYSDGALSNRNILINGNLAVNQRSLSIASVSTGAYGEDRWKKTAGGMTQIIEEANYLPSTVYTLSGTNVTTQQITSPASGNWTLPDIAVTARLVQLELGDQSTPFEHRSYGDELRRCQRYYNAQTTGMFIDAYNVAGGYAMNTVTHPSTMRAAPSMAINNSGSSNLSQLVAATPTPERFIIRLRAAGTGRFYVDGFTYTADAEL